MGEGEPRRRALGLVLDLAVLLVVLGIAYAAAVPRERYFDIRGANMVGIAATYHSSALRGYAVDVEVEGAWFAGGSFRAAGRVVYADSKRLVLYDAQKGVLVLSDEFDALYVDGVPSRVLLKISSSEGVRRVDALFPGGGRGCGHARDLCSAVSGIRGVEACLVSAAASVWMEESNVTIPASMIQDLAAREGGIVEVETAGNEIILRMRFVPGEDSASLLGEIRGVLGREGVPVRDVLWGPVRVTVLIDPRSTDAGEVGDALRELGATHVEPRLEG